MEKKEKGKKQDRKISILIFVVIFILFNRIFSNKKSRNIYNDNN